MGRAYQLQRVSTLIILVMAMLPAFAQETYDIVISNGRVMDPETGLDAVRNVGIRGQSVVAITERTLQGTTEVNARGLVVSPGFIDLHAHGQSARANEFQAMDGVTTALELESGVPDIPGFLAMRSGNAVINYGASVSHGALRVWSMPEHTADIDRIATEIAESGEISDELVEAFYEIITEGR